MRKRVVLTVMLLLILSAYSVVFASDIITVVGGGNGLSNPNIGGVGTVAGKILGVIRWAGYAIALGTLMWLGAKYVMAAADERATLKGSAWKYILGALLISGASTFLGFIMEMKG